MEPNGYYWYTEHDDDGTLVYDCVCVIVDYFGTLLLPGGSVVTNRLVSRMDGRLVPLKQPVSGLPVGIPNFVPPPPPEGVGVGDS